MLSYLLDAQSTMKVLSRWNKIQFPQCVCVCVGVHACLCACTPACMHVWPHVCMHACLCVHMRMYVCTCLCVLPCWHSNSLFQAGMGRWRACRRSAPRRAGPGGSTLHPQRSGEAGSEPGPTAQSPSAPQTAPGTPQRRRWSRRPLYPMGGKERRLQSTLGWQAGIQCLFYYI